MVRVTVSNAEEASVCMRCHGFIQKGEGGALGLPPSPQKFDVIIASTVTIGLASYQGCLPCEATIGYMT